MTKDVKKVIATVLVSNTIFHNNRYQEKGEKIVLNDNDELLASTYLLGDIKEASKIDVEKDELGSIRLIDTLSLKDEKIKFLETELSELKQMVAKLSDSKNDSKDDKKPSK